MSRIGAHILALAFAFAIASATVSATAYGAQADIDDYLEREWYYVETLFFRYLAPPNDEDFSRQAVPQHPLELAALEPPPAAYSERIAQPPDPLDFPRLEQFDCIAPTPAPWMETHDAAELPPDPDAALHEDGESEIQPPNVAIAPVPTGPPAPLPGQLARLALEEFERGLMRTGWRWRDDDLSLRTAATRMRRSGDYAVMHHGRWLQAVPPRDSAAPLLIQLGALMPDATFELEGSVSVTLGRFLHFAAQVWLRQVPPDARAALDRAGEASISETDTVPIDADGSKMDPASYVLLSESRRMRPGELHYLDHPWLGILVRIEPVEAPDALLARLESFPDGILLAQGDRP